MTSSSDANDLVKVFRSLLTDVNCGKLMWSTAMENQTRTVIPSGGPCLPRAAGAAS